jgi:integrase/recombinase XerD
MQDKPPIALYLDTRSASKKHGGKFHVKVRITFPEGADYVLTKQFLSREEFEPIEKGKAKGSLKDVQEKINIIRRKVDDVVDDVLNRKKRITIPMFWETYDGSKVIPTKSVLVKDLFQEVIDTKVHEDTIGTADYYRDAMKSLVSFGGDDLSLLDIDEAWLKSYELSQTAKGNSINTASAYMRALRAVFRKARKRGLVTHYPFNNDDTEGYTIRRKRSKKRPVDLKLLHQLITFETYKAPDNTPRNRQREIGEAEAKDFILFSFICNGMNFADMAYLHQRDFKSFSFSFIRRKSQNTVNEQTPIEVWISPIIREILTRRAIHSPYVFGKITDEMSAEEKDKAIYQWRRTTNKWFKRIALALGFDGDVNSQRLRHSFTSEMLNANIPITKVKDALGHSSVTTTENYAEDLDMETSKNFSEVLLRRLGGLSTT